MSRFFLASSKKQYAQDTGGAYNIIKNLSFLDGSGGLNLKLLFLNGSSSLNILNGIRL